jgi:cell division protein FtsB
MSENTQKPDPKAEKINDLMAVVTIMEDYWRFHPANPDKQDVVQEYAQLEAIKDSIEKEIEELDANSKG